MTDTKVGNILFYWAGNSLPILKFKTNTNNGQGLIHFDRDNNEDEYVLYKWFDEGEFLKIFDVINYKDSNSRFDRRLKVVGVDEIE